jgi:hypothetical protein
MKKPELQVIGGQGLPLWGECSCCPETKFGPPDRTKGEIEQKAFIRALFDEHLMRSHPDIARSTKESREEPRLMLRNSSCTTTSTDQSD